MQSDHVHLIVEGDSNEAVSRGLQGLGGRLARAWNKLWVRKGSVFAERYHRRDLPSPSQVRRGLVYVLQNARKHGARLWVDRRRDRSGREARVPRGMDAFSSAITFGGWLERGLQRLEPDGTNVRPRSWLLREGWKRAGGLLSIKELPKAARLVA